MNDRLKQTMYQSIGIFAALVAVLIFTFSVKSLFHGSPARDGIYAVFLTNGQSYFGRISDESKDRVVLEQVFYPKVKRDAVTDPSEETDAQLVKFGTEIYAPEDRMEILIDNILFITKLQDNGKLAEAIKGYKSE